MAVMEVLENLSEQYKMFFEFFLVVKHKDTWQQGCAFTRK